MEGEVLDNEGEETAGQPLGERGEQKRNRCSKDKRSHKPANTVRSENGIRSTHPQLHARECKSRYEQPVKQRQISILSKTVFTQINQKVQPRHICAEQGPVQPEEQGPMQHELLWCPITATTWSATKTLVGGGMLYPFVQLRTNGHGILLNAGVLLPRFLAA